MGLLEVDVSRMSAKLLDDYTESYAKVYGVEPIISSNGSDQTIMKDIVKNVGFEKARRLVRLYPFVQEEYLIKRAHDLKVLKENLGLVNSKLGKELTAERLCSGLMVNLHGGSYCPRCNKNFEMVVNSNNIEKTYMQTPCEACR